MFDWFLENFLKSNADKCHLIKRLRLTSRYPILKQLVNAGLSFWAFI